MHEFALASSIRDITVESAEAYKAIRVRSVRCRIGAMRQVVPSLMHTAFEACCADSIARGAELMIEIDPVVVTCRACLAVSRALTTVYQCPRCESFEIQLNGGTEMTITSIEVDVEDNDGDCGPT
jgi:hydrogenase nickel incorporation protein HypA/HybF